MTPAPTLRPPRRARRLGCPSALLVAAALLVGCSGGDEGAAPATSTTTTIRVPDVIDEVCTDPTADLSELATEFGGLAEPTGIDLVQAEVHVDPTTLELAFRTNGAIDAVPGPAFAMFQGPIGMQSSWELRLEPAAGGWVTALVTNAPGDGRVQVAEQRRPVAAVPVVDGDTITVRIPRDQLPPPLTLAWGFGSSAVDGSPTGAELVAAPPPEPGGTTTTTEAELASVFDECSTFASPGASSDTTAP